LKIAILQPSLTWRGGAERQVLSLAIELQKMGHEPEIFTCAASDSCYPELLRELIVIEIKVPFIQGLQSKNLSKNPNFHVAKKRSAARRLARSFRNYYYNLPAMVNLGMKIPKGFDVINNQNCPTEWAAFFAKKRLNAPIVWSCNEPPFWFTDPNQRKALGKINLPLYEGLDRVAVNSIDRIVALSAIGGRRIEQAYRKPYEIVHTGVNLFHNASGKKFRERYSLEKDFLILQVGNIAPDKRQIDSLLALHLISKNYDNVKLIFVGAGPIEQLVELKQQLGIEKKVLFLQNISDSELSEVYAACDVFVFPSQITWGLAVIEAMSASKPVLVSNKSGSSEIIKHGQNGFVLEQPYPKNMALQIKNLIVNSELRYKVGENAYEFVKKNLSWEAYAKNMALVFERTLRNFKN
jgi:glycosyltransferase involved in cell wall biosynthesis